MGAHNKNNTRRQETRDTNDYVLFLGGTFGFTLGLFLQQDDLLLPGLVAGVEAINGGQVAFGGMLLFLQQFVAFLDELGIFAFIIRHLIFESSFRRLLLCQVALTIVGPTFRGDKLIDHVLHGTPTCHAQFAQHPVHLTAILQHAAKQESCE
jgi:hypothetical protein